MSDDSIFSDKAWLAEGRHNRASASKTPKMFGKEEFGVVYPTFLGGEPDRIMFYSTQPELNTLEHMESERQRWIDRGEDAYVVSRQWKML